MDVVLEEMVKLGWTEGFQVVSFKEYLLKKISDQQTKESVSTDKN